MTRIGRSRTCTRLGLALAVVAAGIGGGAGEAVAAKAPTRTTAKAFAKAVNLVAADVPGFAAKSSQTKPGDQHFGEMVAKCAGGVNPKLALVNVDSPDFTQEAAQGLTQLQVNSNVTVLPSARLAAKDLKAVRSAKGRSCLAKATSQLLKTMKIDGVTFGGLSVTQIVRKAPGADGSFALRFKVIASSGGQKIPFYIDTIGFTRGPAEIGLTTLGIAAPFPTADEQRLVTLLAGRAVYNRI